MNVLVCVLPGPDRKATDHLYRFRMVHRGGEQDECRQLWQADGGRDIYQVALDDRGRWHCTCATSTYRPEYCKHIRALKLFVGDCR